MSDMSVGVRFTRSRKKFQNAKKRETGNYPPINTPKRWHKRFLYIKLSKNSNRIPVNNNCKFEKYDINKFQIKSNDNARQVKFRRPLKTVGDLTLQAYNDTHNKKLKDHKLGSEYRKAKERLIALYKLHSHPTQNIFLSKKKKKVLMCLVK